jgi:putative ATP-dependent endonuclease of OLD family
MRVRRIRLHHFRGVSAGTVLLEGNALLVGSNSVGKSTVCEALVPLGTVLRPATTLAKYC